MPTPFLALAPFDPRIVDIPYSAFALSCAPDCTDCSDVSDSTDSSDVSDSDDLIIE
jgi:hypothetical protein